MKEIEAKFSLKKAEIRNEIEEIFIEMNVAKQNIKNSYEAIQSAQESLRLAILRLKAGITTQREVFNNQKDLTQAEVKHIEAITKYNQNMINLQRKTGINAFKECNIVKGSSSSSFNKDSCLDLL